MQKAQCPQSSQKGSIQLDISIPSISHIFQSFFSMVGVILFPHHPANTFKCMKSQLIKEAYSSLLDSRSYVLSNKIITFLRIGVDSYILQNFRAPNDT